MYSNEEIRESYLEDTEVKNDNLLNAEIVGVHEHNQKGSIALQTEDGLIFLDNLNLSGSESFGLHCLRDSGELIGKLVELIQVNGQFKFNKFI